MTHSDESNFPGPYSADGRVPAVYRPAHLQDPHVVTGRCGHVEIVLWADGRVTMKGLGGQIQLGHRDHIQGAIEGLIGAQLEPLPATLRRRFMLWRGWRFFEVRERGS
jgi:hypothetical protein